MNSGTCHKIQHDLKGLMRKQKLIFDEIAQAQQEGRTITPQLTADFDQTIGRINQIWSEYRLRLKK